MEQPNVEIIRENYLALNRGDGEALIALTDPDVEWDMSRRTFDSRVYHGHAGVARLCHSWQSSGGGCESSPGTS
jgi:ketosteroid isomerase-like protein